MKLSDNDQNQVVNIVNTIIEASEHFLELTKEKKYTESLYIFSSIIEGITVVQNIINTDDQLKDNLNTYQYKITDCIKSISSTLEKNELIKVTETLQFVFLPTLRSWKKELLASLPNIKPNENITIGVYENTMNPIDAYPDKRIEALVNEAQKSKINIFFFASKDVDLNNKQIHADFFENNQRKKSIFPFPDVIHNIFPKSIYQQSLVERKLRKQIPFTSFVFGDKFNLPKTLVKNRKFAELLAPFKVVNEEYIIHNFLRDNDKAVIKPIRGARGENIYFVQKKGDRYRVTERKNTVIMNKENFSNLIQEKILPNNYIVQKYINARTKNDEPFDFRAHMQKNGEGKWQITKIYPRTGSSNSIQIDLIKGGKLRNTEEFLIHEFGEKEGKDLDNKMKKLAMDLSFHIDKLHGLAIDEMGLDIAIDVNKRFWLHEANIGPQTFAHENERAANVVAYSKYLAKNRIFHTNQYNDRNLLKNQFNSTNSKLEYLKSDEKLKIGILGKPNEIDNFVLSTAYIAKYEDVYLFYFSPNDVDYEEMLIRGKFYENSSWVEKVVSYPDVIYDRLKSTNKNNNIYEEFQNIPIMNEIYDSYLNSLDIYEHLASANLLEDYLLPFRKITKAKELISFIDQYIETTVKPITKSSSKHPYYIEKLKALEYLVIENGNEEIYNKLTLEHLLKELLKNNQYFVTKKRAYHNDNKFLKVQLIKGLNNDWEIVNIYPVIIPEPSNGIEFASDFNSALKLTSVDSGKLEKELKDVSTKVSETLNSKYEHLSELELYFYLDSNHQLKISKVNLNQLNTDYNELHVAKKVLECAKSINNRKIKTHNKETQTLL
ncbi:YheC/YheD family protein [Piscibacillus halophilus]|uniref:YheC/YheD family protein n=1 Tax=Piscibacillus halophilus TaxID=571933 RepID=UPI00158EE09E|nr:YheC/YheD family protein [Piscibacillus halophilus]